ncbi:MAG: methylenetetrahydrofolate reductase [NAD(P)H] [Pseudomonadota bacterium]
MPPVKVSFEFFPPKSDKMAETLWMSLGKLGGLDPEFVSVTYGAGGSTRDRTHKTVSRIVSETEFPVAAHLTTVDATRETVNEVLRDYWSAGVRHIVALRGDPPAGVGEKYVPTEGGYANAAELTAGAREIADFEITVGCYPEKHPESASLAADIEFLKAKVDAGATRAITQFFFDNDVYDRYVEQVRAAGIDIPIVPGIMPVSNFKSLCRMSELCGASVPARLHDLFADLDDDPATRQLVAATVAAEQCQDLQRRGVELFHFYTLNRAELTLATCRMLGLSARSADVKAA